jgi:hypothetical protein
MAAIITATIIRVAINDKSFLMLLLFGMFDIASIAIIEFWSDYRNC